MLSWAKKIYKVFKTSTCPRSSILRCLHKHESCFLRMLGKYKKIIQKFPNFGFIIHPELKFVPHPSYEKKRQLKSFCTNILLATATNICKIASILGKITSSFSAAKFCRLYYRGLERCKTAAFTQLRGNFNDKNLLQMRLSMI